jgi:mannosyl-3-phosphoglycerate phosphatase
MTIEEICEATGLEPQEAKRAANRHYGEPILWLGTEHQKKNFIEMIVAMGAKPLIGGRFLHISGECDKGGALRWLCNEFNRQYPDYQCTSVALGDGQNDIAMLDAADIAVRIKSPSNDFPPLKRTEHVYDSVAEGPQGWSDSLEQLLNLTL